jgi:cyclophilin family peptidyl-prolyl cis-trans isomerase
VLAVTSRIWITLPFLLASAAFAQSTLPAGYTAVPFLSTKPVHAFKEAPKQQLEKGKDYVAVMETSKGRIILDLFENDTPTSVNSFVWLARHHYYDGILFHRVMDQFVVQGGDPNTLEKDRNKWGTGGPGYSFGLEVRTKLNFDTKGILGMARSQSPDSNGSQFYITLAPASSLNGSYTVFGKVTEGLDILDKITKYQSPDPKGTPDKIIKVTIAVKKK